MCGRYTLARSQQELSERFGIKQIFIDLIPRYNIAPTQQVPVVLSVDSENKIELYQWGLIPSWTKDLKTSKPLINARCESLAEKPSFKSALKSRRCLVPADGFYEWKKLGSQKQPMFIHAPDNGIFSFAGIWDEWRNPDGVPVRTFSIVTTAANDMMTPVHDRMPVILSREDESKWLDPAIKKAEELLPLLKPCDNARLTMHEVSPRVNSFKDDDPGLIEPSGGQMQLRLNLHI